jgi:hypothetical protein
VVKEKKKGRIMIFFDLINSNDTFLHDPFLIPFAYEVLDNVGGQEAD